MKYRGKILCKECKAVLNESGEPVLEREKAWCERQAIYMCRPNCAHAKSELEKQNGLCFGITVEWGPWEEKTGETT